MCGLFFYLSLLNKDFANGRDVGNVKNFVGVTCNFLTLFAVIISYYFFLMSLLQPCNIADN